MANLAYKAALRGENAILKRTGGLRKIQFKGKPAKYKTDEQAFKRRDQNYDGEFMEEFEENIIGGAVTVLAPFWNDLQDTYWVHEKNQDGEGRPILKSLVEALKLRYPDDHPDSPRKIIKYEDVDPNNYWDPFFQNPRLQAKQMRGGRYIFEYHKDPVDALLYFCYLHDPRVIIKGDDREISKYIASNAQYELVYPTQKTADSKAELKAEIELMGLIGGMEYERQKLIAKAMRLNVGDYEQPDPDRLLVEIGMAAKNTKTNKRFGTSPKEWLLQLAKLGNEDLQIHADIAQGIDLRIITRQRNKYYLNNVEMPDVSTENQLFTFLKLEVNREQFYDELLFLIGEKLKVNT